MTEDSWVVISPGSPVHRSTLRGTILREGSPTTGSDADSLADKGANHDPPSPRTSHAPHQFRRSPVLATG